MRALTLSSLRYGAHVSDRPVSPLALVEALEAHGCMYEEERYSGLVSPATVTVPPDVVSRLTRDLHAVWEWNRTWHQLYAQYQAGHRTADDPLALGDYGMAPVALDVQRTSTALKRDPAIGRVDSIALAPDQSIAEIQWKGGGEGFAAGIQAAYLEKVPLLDRESPLGSRLTDSWAKFYKPFGASGEVFVVTSTRGTWLPSESYLINSLKLNGVVYKFIPRQVIGSNLRVQNDHLEAQHEDSWRRIDYLSLDRITEALPEDLLRSVIRLYDKGSLHIEPPPSYLYSQKIGYALPWHPKYRDAFSDDVRRIMIPAVCLNDGVQSLAILAEHIDHQAAPRLAELTDWDDLQNCPDSLRRQIVVKCASINGQYNHGGRGVWRLGSRSTLDRVLARMKRGEPWIAQPYVSRKWDVPLALPKEDDASVQSCHARFCLYGTSDGAGHAELLGGIATLSPFWKSAGKTAAVDPRGQSSGSAFVDLRTFVE